MIELKRGNTLTLDHAAGATICVFAGEVWLSISETSSRMRAGQSIHIGSGDTVLIHALEDALLGLQAAGHCRVELRRRGEVTATSADIF